MIELSIAAIVEVAAAVLYACSLCAILFVSLSVRRWRTRCQALETCVAAMRREIETVASISLRTGRRVKRIERDHSAVADRVELLEQRRSAASFDQAIDSARRGTDPGSLTQHFGLSRVEADLVTRLHGAKKTA